MRKNGVKQGAVLSGTLYCFFCNQFFQRLRNSKSGCWINQHYLGIFGYSDDNFLLAPSLSALQDMLKICEEYAKEHGLKFSTDPNPPKNAKPDALHFYRKKENRDISNCVEILSLGRKMENILVTIYRMFQME